MIDSVRSLFRHPGLRRTIVALRVPLVIVVVLALLPLARREWLLPGFALSMVGEAIQLWCFAALEKNDTLTARGPYTMVRNPMYLGRFFIVAGFLLLLGQPWLLAVFAVGYWLYMESRVGREERLLAGIFGAAYADYCARVRRFIPGAPLPGAPVLYWNWDLFRRNSGPKNLLLTLAAWVVAAGWVIWRGQ
ncbi:MAG: methyltransferase family protein [Betaproteobacteria bacterium]